HRPKVRRCYRRRPTGRRCCCSKPSFTSGRGATRLERRPIIWNRLAVPYDRGKPLYNYRFLSTTSPSAIPSHAGCALGALLFLLPSRAEYLGGQPLPQSSGDTLLRATKASEYGGN